MAYAHAPAPGGVPGRAAQGLLSPRQIHFVSLFVVDRRAQADDDDGVCRRIARVEKLVRDSRRRDDRSGRRKVQGLLANLGTPRARQEHEDLLGFMTVGWRG